MRMLRAQSCERACPAEEVAVVVVGGGAALCGGHFAGASRVVVPEHADVANAIGAAILQVTGAGPRSRGFEILSPEKARQGGGVPRALGLGAAGLGPRRPHCRHGRHCCDQGGGLGGGGGERCGTGAARWRGPGDMRLGLEGGDPTGLSARAPVQAQVPRGRRPGPWGYCACPRGGCFATCGLPRYWAAIGGRCQGWAVGAGCLRAPRGSRASRQARGTQRPAAG